MSDIAVRCAGLGKQYRIGQKVQPSRTLREVVSTSWKTPFRRLHNRRESAEQSLFWALEDVSFEVRRGETVGILGRNGSGKSTLLKILSRITEPTRGRAEIYGRVGSLLEVGTGFHMELTGRENIYLNGAILGMRRAHIRRKFDEIVAFAEVDRFIDTAVKHYSTGMYLRLAFAVAAFLEPEILLVDEVLAVGDARFQKKCLSKMEDVGNEGRTVFFVSHNMPAVARLCRRAILIDSGRIRGDGPPHQIVSAYLQQGVLTTAEREWPDLDRAPGTDVVRLRGVRIKNPHGRVSDTIDIREAIQIEMEYEVLKDGYLLTPHFSVHNQDGLEIFSGMDSDTHWRGTRRSPGRYLSTSWIPGNFLSEGMVIIGPAITTLNPNMLQFHARDAVAFTVVDSFDGDSTRGDFPGVINGVVRPLLKWTTEYRTESEVVGSI